MRLMAIVDNMESESIVDDYYRRKTPKENNSQAADKFDVNTYSLLLSAKSLFRFHFGQPECGSTFFERQFLPAIAIDE